MKVINTRTDTRKDTRKEVINTRMNTRKDTRTKVINTRRDTRMEVFIVEEKNKHSEECL